MHQMEHFKINKTNIGLHACESDSRTACEFGTVSVFISSGYGQHNICQTGEKGASQLNPVHLYIGDTDSLDVTSLRPAKNRRSIHGFVTADIRRRTDACVEQTPTLGGHSGQACHGKKQQTRIGQRCAERRHDCCCATRKSRDRQNGGCGPRKINKI
jgi:hypothetical protein